MAVTADTSVVEIVCEAHFAHLTSALKDLAAAGMLTDITFVCEDGTLQAHQAVLSAFSASLRQISVTAGRSNCLLVTNSRKPVMQALLHYLYLGYACVHQQDLAGLTQAADALKLDCFSQTLLEYSGDKVYLKFPEHERLLRENLARLRSSPALCDVVIVTEEFSRVYSNACVVATCSGVLRDVLAERKRGNDGPCVLVLEGVKLEHLSPVIDFCYCGSASMAHEVICEVHATARLLDVGYVCEILAAVDAPLPAATDADGREGRASRGTVRLLSAATEGGDERGGFRNFQRVLSHLASAESLTDVTLLKDGRHLRAHSVLLCAFGPYFKELEERLKHELKEAVVLVRSLSGSMLQSYLDYLYRGEAQFCGSPKQFCALMSNWIDFSLLPAEDATSLACEGLTAEKTCEVLGLSLDNISCVVELSEEFDLGRDAVLIQGDSETVELVSHQAGSREHKKSEDNMTRWVELTALKVEEGEGSSAAKSPPKTPPKVCKICKEEFASVAEFKRHYAGHPETKWVSCSHCSKTFTSLGELRVHMRSHTELRPFQCGVCNKSFAARSVLRKHRRIHDGEPAKAYRCSVCSKSFLRREYFHEHLRTHTGTKPFKCPTCGKAFVGRTGLNHHVKTHTSADERRNCPCDVCGKYFTRHALWTHAKTHEKVHACATCGKTCATPAALRVHVRGMHLGERDHTCHVCARSFGERRHLLRHIRSHDQDKDYRYMCSGCSKVFKTEEQLKKHSSLHHKVPGEQPYSCEVCSKAFAGRSALVYHRRSHTGERPHACSVCGKSFHRPDALKKHECSCRGEAPSHRCPHCKETFSGVVARNEHVRLHHEKDKAEMHTKVCSSSRPFRCTVCRKTFHYQDSLDKHSKMHLGEQGTVLHQEEAPLHQEEAPLHQEKAPLYQEEVPLHQEVPVLCQAEDLLHREVALHQGMTLHQEEATLHHEAPLHREEATLHQEAAPLHQEEATLHQEEPVLHQEEPVLHQGEPVLHQAEVLLHREVVHQGTTLHQGTVLHHEEASLHQEETADAALDHDYACGPMLDSLVLKAELMPEAPEQHQGRKTRQPFTITIDGNLAYNSEHKASDSDCVVLSEAASSSVQDSQVVTWSLP